MPDQLQRGGIVGAATIGECIPSCDRTSAWHIEGAYGFRFEDGRALPFVECKGALSFFDISKDVATQLRQMHDMGVI